MFPLGAPAVRNLSRFTVLSRRASKAAVVGAKVVALTTKRWCAMSVRHLDYSPTLRGVARSLSTVSERVAGVSRLERTPAIRSPRQNKLSGGCSLLRPALAVQSDGSQNLCGQGTRLCKDRLEACSDPSCLSCDGLSSDATMPLAATYAFITYRSPRARKSVPNIKFGTSFLTRRRIFSQLFQRTKNSIPQITKVSSTISCLTACGLHP